jgi:hypothetical protein
MVFDLSNFGKWNFHYITVRTFHFYAGCGQSLGCLQAANLPAHTFAVRGYNFDVAFAVERLKRFKRFASSQP